jgi:hypothetical protein
MPSKRRQFNIRPDDATWSLIDRVKPLIEAAIGIEVSQSELLRLGMLALEEKYAPREPKRGKKPAG